LSHDSYLAVKEQGELKRYSGVLAVKTRKLKVMVGRDLIAFLDFQLFIEKLNKICIKK
jgi:hypothetical protein